MIIWSWLREVQTHNLVKTFLESGSNIKLGHSFIFDTCCCRENKLTPVFFPSGLSAAAANLSSYVKRGIECWSNSGFHTPLITSISVGGLTIMDSKIFQSPLKNSNPWRRRSPSPWLLCLPRSKYLGTLKRDKYKHLTRVLLPQPWFMWSLVYNHA